MKTIAKTLLGAIALAACATASAHNHDQWPAESSSAMTKHLPRCYHELAKWSQENSRGDGTAPAAPFDCNQAKNDDKRTPAAKGSTDPYAHMNNG